MKNKIIATFDVNNEFEEMKLINHLEGIGGRISIKPFNEHLQKDSTYRKLKKAKRDAENAYYNYLNNNR